MIYVNDQIDEINEKALEKALSALPEWRKAQAMRFKHVQGRKECAFSYLLLCRALEERGILLQPTFLYGENGKPTMAELPDLHFNLSHCKVAVVCALSNCPIGIDVEKLGRYNERLARHTMNDDEMQEISTSEDKDVAFTRLWTMKEATMKLTGEGIGTNVRNVLRHSSNIIYTTHVNKSKGYVVTTAEYVAQ